MTVSTSPEFFLSSGNVKIVFFLSVFPVQYLLQDPQLLRVLIDVLKPKSIKVNWKTSLSSWSIPSVLWYFGLTAFPSVRTSFHCFLFTEQEMYF